MRYGSNDLLLPPGESAEDAETDPESMTTLALFDDPRLEAQAQMHARIAPPLLALAFALLAVPLARSSPRQTRFGSVVIGFLAYLVGMDMMLLGTDWLGDGKVPMAAGLWWLVLPLLALGAWFYFSDGRLARRPRLRRTRA
jgi:lipopolysaccharide export system permease protein